MPCMIGPQREPVSQPPPGRSAMANAVSIISELPFEFFLSSHSSQHCTATGVIMAIRTVIDGVKALKTTPITAHAAIREGYDGRNRHITRSAIRLPSPVLCSTVPKKSAGISVQMAGCVKPENTVAGFNPARSEKHARKSPPIDNGRFSGRITHKPIVISMPETIICP